MLSLLIEEPRRCQQQHVCSRLFRVINATHYPQRGPGGSEQVVENGELTPQSFIWTAQSQVDFPDHRIEQSRNLNAAALGNVRIVSLSFIVQHC
jgi:hypothetical protein